MITDREPHTLVIGIGNRDRGDDAAGPLVADAVRNATLEPSVTTTILEGDLSDLSLRWDPAQTVIIVDAAVTGAPLGTIHRDIELTACGTRPISSHGVSLQDAIELGRRLDRMPEELTVVGIEARSFEHFDDPGAEVLQAVEVVAAEIIDRLAVRPCR